VSLDICDIHMHEVCVIVICEQTISLKFWISAGIVESQDTYTGKRNGVLSHKTPLTASHVWQMVCFTLGLGICFTIN
jgi:hypothetical protein